MKRGYPSSEMIKSGLKNLKFHLNYLNWLLEKRKWIAKLVRDQLWDPILVTPIKDSGYYLLTDGWHRVQAAKKLKQKEIEALPLPAEIGLSMAKANKILRDIDREFKFKLHCSDIIGHWAMMQTLLED